MELQFDLNIENKSESEVQFDNLQKQIDAIADSTGKVRRKLFAEMGELKKLIVTLQDENSGLRDEIALLKNEKKSWQYMQSYTLFDRVG